MCAEIGIDRGDFSEKILKITTPKKLHLFDISSSCIRNAEKRFRNEIDNNTIEVHLGDSSSKLESMQENYFDWVYIDGDHSYEGCKNDLNAVRIKMKKGGFILLNDYTYFGPSNFKKFGVVEAVNEFCIEFDYEILYMALQSRLYNDVLITPIKK